MAQKDTIFGGLKKLFRARQQEAVTLATGDRLRLSGKSTFIRCPGTSFVVEMGKQTVHVCPDPAHPPDAETHDYLLFDPKLYDQGISHALRLRPGEALSVDHRQAEQALVFSRPRHAFRRHLQIVHHGDVLEFKDPISELGTYVSVLADDKGGSPLAQRFKRNLDRIKQLFGEPIQLLPPDEALDLLAEVNGMLAIDPFRKLDSLGNAGSLVELPVNLTPIVVGDLHGQVNNLLRILLENAFLETLEGGEAALIFLGDAIHREEPDKLEEMESSMLIMDLIFRLKLQFPRQVFFLVGNHDSFSADVMKGGVAQSLLWEKYVIDTRGREYAQQLALFYRHSPLFVLSKNFLACHAGPPRSVTSVKTLIEARQFPELVHQLTWGRIKSKGWPVGYKKGDVKRLRKSLEIEDDRPFIVAHYPQERTGSVWLNVGEIPNHHIIYSARGNEVGLFTRVKGEMVVQVYPSLDLLGIINGPAT